MVNNDPPKIKISNIIAKSQLIPPFSLSSLSVAFPFSHRSAFSRIILPFHHMNFSIFRTGSVISRATNSVSDVEDSFNWLRSILFPFGLELSDRYTILNIVAVANCAPPIVLSSLAANLPNCSFDPFPVFSEKDDHQHLVNCITYRFPKDKFHYTSLIFSSGKAIFTGFKSIPELGLHAFKFSSLISKISRDHPEVLAK